MNNQIKRPAVMRKRRTQFASLVCFILGIFFVFVSIFMSLGFLIMGVLLAIVAEEGLQNV